MAKQDGLINQSSHGIAQKSEILVMDDQIERHDLFLRFIGNGFDSVYTAETMLTLMENGQVNAKVLFWDHDLGSNMKGSEMVKAMIAQNIELPTVKRIYVHSANLAGNRMMVEDLQQHYPNIITSMTPISWLNDEFQNMKRDKEAFKTFLIGD